MRRLLPGLLLAAAAVAGCAREAVRVPPAASFLLAAGDSTIWVRTDSGDPRMRRAAILLARYEGRFHELYVSDDDRSYFGAVIVGQRAWRRDIVRGDSALVFEDSSIAGIAVRYAATHPGDKPLGPDDEASDDPALVATTETELLDALGRLAMLERHVDFDLEGGKESHVTYRMVMDASTGRRVTLAQLLDDSVRVRVVREGRAAFASARDSVRRSVDERAQRASNLMPDLHFDEESFGIVTTDMGPAIEFFTVGSGRRAGGLGLSLTPIDVPAGDWWRDVSTTLPSVATDSSDEWHGEGYDVLVQYDSAQSTGLLLLRDASGEEWPIGTVPLPIWRLHRLELRARDRATHDALTRAFDEAGAVEAPRTASAGVATPPLIPASRKKRTPNRE